MSQAADQPGLSPADVPAPHAGATGDPLARVPWAAVWVTVVSVSAVAGSALVFAAGGTRGFFVPLLAGAVCLVAAFFDAWTGRIPNPLTYTAALLGLALNGAAPLFAWLGLATVATWLGGPGATQSLLGFAACVGLWVVTSVLGAGVHGGDLKLLVALGALLGLTQTGNVLILALAAAVVYSLINLAVRGHLNAVVRIAAQRVMELVFLRRFHTPMPEGAAAGSARQIPMAVPLALGLVLAYYWQWRTGGTVL